MSGERTAFQKISKICQFPDSFSTLRLDSYQTNSSTCRYERILLRIIGTGTANQQDASKKLLSWIAVARRPLRWYEIQASYSINLDDETINTEEGRLRGTAKDHCASFVDVRADQTVSFVHGTVKT